MCSCEERAAQELHGRAEEEGAAVERMWDTYDSQGQILALVESGLGFQVKLLKTLWLFHLRSEAAKRTPHAL
jgi:hypothetical protein